MILQTSGASRRGIAELYLNEAVIARSEATKQSSLAVPLLGLLRFGRNDDPST
jgi:hypothetical protein